MPRNPRPVGTPLGRVQVQLGLLRAGEVHPSGVDLHVGKVEGWFDPVAVTGQMEQRSGANGAWTTPSYLAGRQIILELRPVGWSWDHLTPVLDEIVAALPIDGWADFICGGRQARVRVSGDPTIIRRGTGAVVSVMLDAPDPRRYGVGSLISQWTGLPTAATTGGLKLPTTLPIVLDVTYTSGELEIVVDGTISTPPILTVAGPITAGTTITHAGPGPYAGQTLYIPDATLKGQNLVIDTDRGTALLNGEPRTVTGEFFHLSPGTNTLRFGGSLYSSYARLTVQYRPAWR